MERLKKVFFNLLAKYTTDKDLISQYWNEIIANYNAENRHYHTMTHLENLYQQLLAVKQDIQQWDTILFSLFYHDFVYDILKNDNEQQSALAAQARMEKAFVPLCIIQNCCAQILATQKHELQNDADCNYFLDTDLSVLGFEQDNYLQYTNQIRQEYSCYPDEVYIFGRIKVLKHFLAMNRIFKTQFFKNKYEKNAISNIKRELELLGKL